MAAGFFGLRFLGGAAGGGAAGRVLSKWALTAARGSAWKLRCWRTLCNRTVSSILQQAAVNWSNALPQSRLPSPLGNLDFSVPPVTGTSWYLNKHEAVEQMPSGQFHGMQLRQGLLRPTAGSPSCPEGTTLQGCMLQTPMAASVGEEPAYQAVMVLLLAGWSICQVVWGASYVLRPG